MGERGAALDALSATPGRLAQVIEAHPPEMLRARPFDGKWTALEILGHLTDAEWAFGWRTRMVLGAEDYQPVGFPQEAWVDAQGFNEREPAELLEHFRALRACNLAAWRRLTPAQLARTCRSRRRGTVTLAQLLEAFAKHDGHHLGQMQRYLAQVAG